MSDIRAQRSELSRRNVLRLAFGAGIGAPLLAACGRDEDDPDEEAPSADPSPSESPSAPPALSGSISFSLPMATDGDQAYYEAAIARFTEETGVEVDFLPFPDAQFAESIQGLFRGGDEPDVFRMVKAPAQMRVSYENEWIQPLDGYPVITDFLREHYGEEALDPIRSGLHIENKLYSVPCIGNPMWNTPGVLMVNMDLLEQYGIDTAPETWNELRDTAAKITTDSGGDVFGYAMPGADMLLPNQMVMPYVVMAGPVRHIAGGVPVDLQTGRAGAAHESVAGAVQLMRDLVEDGSVITGWQSMGGPDFWQAWASGRVAMSPIAPWWSEETKKINPDVDTSTVPIPVPDSGRGGYGGSSSLYAPTWGMSRSSENPEAAAQFMVFLSTPEEQKMYYDASAVPTALAEEYADDLSDNARSILEIQAATRVVGPSVVAREPEASKANSLIQAGAPQPDWRQIVFEAIDGGADYAAAAAKYDDALNATIEQALEETGFDPDLYAFPDWNPVTDYEAGA
jgi:multiple sugar transport system substrate-binding protein